MIDAPSNIGLVQAALRKLVSFELIDTDILKENVYGWEEEEKMDFYVEAGGYDSYVFMFSFGEPLYFFFFALL